MSDRVQGERRDPTAVRRMKEQLDEYEQNASEKLAALRENIRRNTPRPVPNGEEEVARESGPPVESAQASEGAPTKKQGPVRPPVSGA